MTKNNNYIINPDTGQLIRIGGVTFQQLVFTYYDFINGELIRRASAPPPATRYYYYNVETGRLIRAGSRRYQELINNGWNIEEYYYLMPPWVVTSNNNDDIQQTLDTVQEAGNFIYQRNQQQRPLTYENIMVRYKDKLDNINISLCRECFIPIEIEEDKYCTDCKSK